MLPVVAVAGRAEGQTRSDSEGRQSDAAMVLCSGMISSW